MKADNSRQLTPQKPNEFGISRLARPLRKRRHSPEHGAIVGVRTMKHSLRLILIGGTAAACCALANPGSAQPVLPQPQAGPIGALPPPPAPGAPAYHAQQLPEAPGTVQPLTLTPRGELDGFLFTDRTHVP